MTRVECEIRKIIITYQMFKNRMGLSNYPGHVTTKVEYKDIIIQFIRLYIIFYYRIRLFMRKLYVKK